MGRQSTEYDDIIGLPHHVSKTRPQMSLYDRAAQFAPFAALTGHGDAVKETARLTEGRVELDEDEKAVLDLKFQQLLGQLQHRPEASITYFVPDERKEGGSYQVVQGRVVKIDSYYHVICLEDGREISMAEIVDLEISHSQDSNGVV